MRTSNGKRKKVQFFTMVLSRSRYKYVYFVDVPFTSQLAIQAHEKAFKFFQGIPQEIVYDQDKVFMNNENHGDLILVEKFQSYVTQQRFSIYFCRKADPETKGKVENVVKYVKQNFLYNRTYFNIETLNDEAIAWLGRTANQMPHGTTKQSPLGLWLVEKHKLTPYVPATLLDDPEYVLYTVKPDNSISYKSNFYSVPQGTYQKPYTNVIVKEEVGYVIIYSQDGNEICKHKKPTTVGGKVINTDHKRDKSKRINQFVNEVAGLFDNPEGGTKYLQKIKEHKPRYVRDQLVLIKNVISKHTQQVINETLVYCMENSIYSASDFSSVADRINENKAPIIGCPDIEIKTLPDTLSKLADMEPYSSNISDYQNLMLN